MKLREGSLTALPVAALVHHQGAAAVALARVLAGGGGAQHAVRDVVRGVVSVSYTSCVTQSSHGRLIFSK